MEAIYERHDVFVQPVIERTFATKLLVDSNKRGFANSLAGQVKGLARQTRFANTEKRSAVFVVSFLVALMIDQVKSLRSLGVKCSMVTSSSGGLTN